MCLISMLDKVWKLTYLLCWSPLKPKVDGGRDVYGGHGGDPLLFNVQAGVDSRDSLRKSLAQGIRPCGDGFGTMAASGCRSDPLLHVLHGERHGRDSSVVWWVFTTKSIRSSMVRHLFVIRNDIYTLSSQQLVKSSVPYAGFGSHRLPSHKGLVLA